MARKEKAARGDLGDGAAAPRGREEAEAAEKARLLKELRALLPRLDGEGLAFLLGQARVHLHNMEMVELEAARAGGGGGAAAAVAPAASALGIERSSSGASYYLSAGNESSMLTDAETLALVRLAFGRADEVEAGRAIGAWLERERRDILNGIFGAGPGAPRLSALAALLRRSFKDPTRG